MSVVAVVEAAVLEVHFNLAWGPSKRERAPSTRSTSAHLPPAVVACARVGVRLFLLTLCNHTRKGAA